MKTVWPDRNIAPRDYQHLSYDELMVSNIFYTIQGEGPFSGKAALFVRLAGCNLGNKTRSCQWCDADFRFDNARSYTLSELIRNLDRVYESRCAELSGISRQDPPKYSSIDVPNQTKEPPILVFTGGEPMLQDNLSYFAETLSADYTVQIESNGTRLAVGFPEKDKNVYLVVSPKAIDNKYRKMNEKVFDRADCLKFLVSADPESAYHNLPDFAFDFLDKGGEVYVSPLAIYNDEPWKEDEHRPYSIIGDKESGRIWDLTKTWENHKRAAELVLQEPRLRLSIQQQIYLGME